MSVSVIECCRLCKSKDLEPFIDLGEQPYSGIFPDNLNSKVPSGKLKLVRCKSGCGLIQMASNFNLDQMYGDNYGYRSGLNFSMVEHLKASVKNASKFASLQYGDLVLDIGANDGTTLNFFGKDQIRLGFDPSAKKFSKFIPNDVKIIFNFFSEDLFNKYSSNKKAKLVTSFSMFYDLPDPLHFAQAVNNILCDDGIWYTEQSYIVRMVEQNSFDTICHEHLEYYGLKQMSYIADKVGFDIIDVDFNDINGGSFVIVFKKSNLNFKCKKFLDLLGVESEKNIQSDFFAKNFSDKVYKVKSDFNKFLKDCTLKGRKVAALGASTKGNVILNFCKIDEKSVQFVGEVNEDKVGKFCPGSRIPIISEQEILSKNFDFYIVLPWHFKESFISKSIFKNKTLVFPLPKLTIVNC